MIYLKKANTKGMLQLNTFFGIQNYTYVYKSICTLHGLLHFVQQIYDTMEPIQNILYKNFITKEFTCKQ